MRYLLKIEYDGTNYKGWQSQKNEKTVQGTIEEKLKIILKTEIKLFAAGRTDAGVHAEIQCTHFDISQVIDKNKTQYSLNALLKKESIVIINIEETTEEFHARFSCKTKEYKYQILVGNIPNLFLNNRYWMIRKFNIKKAQEYGNLICGTHDFSSFRDSQCQSKSPIKTINSCKFEQQNNLITMKIEAKSFLHHQIRIIIGTIYELTVKNEPKERIQEILDKKNRKYAGITAPARGLFLSKIKY